MGGFNQLRTQFQVPAGDAVASAFVYSAALGTGVVSVNGAVVSSLLDAGQTVCVSVVLGPAGGAGA